MLRRRIAGILFATAAVAVLSTGMAGAAIYSEVGDAGSSLATAQAVGVGITAINGSIPAIGDVDLYSFWHTGGLFTADTFTGTMLDSQLFLFDASGLGLWHNDDAAGGFDGLQSRISKTLAAGPYYIGVSAFNYDPRSVGGLIFPDSTSFEPDAVLGPTGPGGASPLSFWAATTGSGTLGTGLYTISLSPPTGVIPEPASLIVWSLLGALGIGLGCWRRRKAA
jgi:hypothetical protein